MLRECVRRTEPKRELPRHFVKNLIITGGWAHEFSDSAAVLGKVLAEQPVNDRVVDSTIADGIDNAIHALQKDHFDVVTVYACWFTMTDERYNAEQRAQWARTTPPELREAIAEHVKRGGGLLVLHTGIICFTDWPEWPQYIGGSWNWGESWHPAVEVFAARWASTLRAPQGHPIVHDLGEIVVEDERYCELGVGPQAQVLLESDGPEGVQPSMWTHERDAGRAVFSSLGHDHRSLNNLQHGRLLRRSIAWVGQLPDTVVREVQ
jgi:type 1 glutamine amidotransferase